MKLENIQDNPFIHKKVENGMVVIKYSRKCFYSNFTKEQFMNMSEQEILQALREFK